MKIKPTLKQSVLGGAIALSLLAGQAANAGLVVTFAESGDDVTATLSGAFAALPERDTLGGAGSSTYVASAGAFNTPPQGAASWSFDVYSFNEPFGAFGTGSALFASSTTSTFGVGIFQNQLNLDQEYVPGQDSFSGVVTWENTDFDTMGFTVGTYTGTLSNDETVQIVIGSSGGGNDVPEPTTLAMVGLGSLGLAGARARRKRATAKASR